MNALSPRLPLDHPKVNLPDDDKSHPEAKLEWWYVNGHLKDEQGREYGFIHALFDAPDAVDARYNMDLPWMPGVTAMDTGLTQETEKIHSQSWRMQQAHTPDIGIFRGKKHGDGDGG